ncbi:MAG: response regulator [Rubripirellula sp.]
MAHRVLFIDDDEALRSAMSRSFTFDYDLTSVNSGWSGLDALAESSDFAVVLLDLQMPEMDGVEFIAKAKELQLGCKFIVLTGNTDAASVEYVNTSSDVFRLLFKPCTKSEIVEAIEAAVAAYEG